MEIDSAAFGVIKMTVIDLAATATIYQRIINRILYLWMCESRKSIIENGWYYKCYIYQLLVPISIPHVDCISYFPSSIVVNGICESSANVRLCWCFAQINIANWLYFREMEEWVGWCAAYVAFRICVAYDLYQNVHWKPKMLNNVVPFFLDGLSS